MSNVEASYGEGYDVIGDVHGHVDKLIALLRQLGDTERDGAWCHAERTVTLRDAAVIPDATQLHAADNNPVDSLPPTALPDNVPRYAEAPPVILGHYWRTGPPRIEGPNTACVDYSAGSGGKLVA
jgi:hypothetical protein